MEARGGVLPGAMRWRRRGRPGEPRSGRPRRADGLLMAYLLGEASPTLPPVPGVDPGGYRDSLLQRCGNPAVRDTLARLCEDTSDRIPSLVLPVVRERLVRGAEITRSALVVASWARYAEGTDEGGRPIDIVDRLAEPAARGGPAPAGGPNRLPLRPRRRRRLGGQQGLRAGVHAAAALVARAGGQARGRDAQHGAGVNGGSAPPGRRGALTPGSRAPGRRRPRADG